MTQYLKVAPSLARFVFYFRSILTGSAAREAQAQAFVVAPFNFSIQNGAYTLASTNEKALTEVKTEILPQTFMQKPDPNLFLLYAQPSGILLFKSRNLKDSANVAGKLTSPSMVVVDTIFHNQVYVQKSANGEDYSFDICYSLLIDGKRYYTDFRPHDFAAFRYPLVHHKQLFMLASQDTGHDMYADKGYPEHFHIAVFDMQNGGIKTRFVSEELPFRYGNEFLDDSDNVIKSEYKAEDQTFRIEIKGLSETYKGVWDGKDLKHLK
ncbi:hypothetical protein LZD49_28425 [Dyadobacter sp. CY261]|uniref:hypothetical protein n=1 Tax=Dyadobacter sp. CY261 TaxID=2907203 RepID=UPI001F3CE995|nr:hypothetical protein [Dyadobacter sp. CY261]MCF0074444.1 hypothetical protein [Dyadobacter sp. CY261]